MLAKTWFLPAFMAAVTLGCSSPANAQIAVNIGTAPACPYGYFDYAPYRCSPAGYYGSEWFNGGAFVGAGPWYHGDNGFHGHVNNHFDPQRGYKGAIPKSVDHASDNFHGNEMRDGRGHGQTDPHSAQSHAARGGHAGGGGHSGGGHGGGGHK